MFPCLSGACPPEQASRRHHLLALGLFLVLGFHVGVWAVELPRLAHALALRPAALGGAVGASAAAGVVSLAGGGRLADRFGRRPVLLTGLGGTALAFAALATVRSFGTLVAVVVLYGLTVSLVDLGANTIGADVERARGRRVMIGLHAGFSLGACLGALGGASLLWAGVGFRTVYLVLAAVLGSAALVLVRASLPPRRDAEPLDATVPGLPRPPRVWRLPGVGLAIAVVTLTFFGDGALESFLGLYLAHWHSPGGLLAGVGIGGYHVAALVGRLSAFRAQRRWSERRLLLTAGLLAALGVAGVVATSVPGLAIGGLLVVGLAEAPIVPTALSAAGRGAPGRSGHAVATATATGYGAFVIGPVVVGGVAGAAGLRPGLALVVGTTLSIAVLATRWPATGRAG